MKDAREHHARVKELFLAACGRPPEVRRHYLEKVCQGDEGLRHEVASLLLHHGDEDEDAEPAEAPSEIPATLGDYRVLRKLGEGGMGEVYEAEQTTPVRRRVALKLIRWGMDTEEVVARFESERQALALMSHPNIARVFQAGTTEQGRPYFAMEYVPGVPITEHCDAHRLSTGERLEAFVAACLGVQHAHQKGVIHRDLKPSNILVTLEDGKPVPKIIDFGVAKATARRLTERTLFTELGQWIGTPEYMSPEQAEAKSLDVDTRTDVYSLGVVLYELLVGARPFDAEELREHGLDEMRRRIREVEPTRPSLKLESLGSRSRAVASCRRTDPQALTKQLRGDLDWITMKALEKDRTRRYGSVADLAEDIQRHLRDEPVVAGPPSPAYRLGKFIRRHRAGVIGGVLMVATLLIAIMGTTFGLLRARREAESARRVSEVLQEIFDDLNPHLRRSFAVTPDDVLDRGVQIIAGKLKGQPLVQARLMRSMGHSYLELGAYEQARPLFEEAIELHRELLGEKHPEFALSISFLADLKILMGDYEEAQRLHEQALHIRREAVGPEHRTVIWSLRSLAEVHQVKAAFERARTLYRQALALAEKTLQPDDQDIATTLDLYAQLETETGHYADALALFERSLAIREAGLGPEHALVAHTLTGLARVSSLLGDYARAEPLCERAVKILEKVFVSDHPTVARPLDQLAEIDLALGRYDEARSLYERALDIRETALGPDHSDVGESSYGLGRLYLLRGDVTAARPLLERALEIVRRPSRSLGTGRAAEPLSSGRRNEARVLDALGLLESRSGDLQKARKLHERAIEVLEETFGPRHPELVAPLSDLGHLLRDMGDEEAARPLLERARQIREEPIGAERETAPSDSAAVR